MGPRRRLPFLLRGDRGRHFGVVATNAAGVDFWSAPARSPIARCATLAVAEYGALSGAESQYAFFAPSVDEQLRLVFEMTEGSGRVRSDVLSDAVNAEVDLRVANLVSLLWWPDEGLHSALEASWATAMFERHPRPSASPSRSRSTTCSLHGGDAPGASAGAGASSIGSPSPRLLPRHGQARREGGSMRIRVAHGAPPAPPPSGGGARASPTTPPATGPQRRCASSAWPPSLLGQAALVAPAYRALYGGAGLVRGPARDLLALPGLPHLDGLTRLLAPAGASTSSVLVAVAACYVLSLILLLLGLGTRAAAALSWFVHLALLATGQGTNYGADRLANIFLFYLVWSPAGGALSLDRRLTRRLFAPTSPVARLSLRVVQLHLCVVYATSGLSKSAGAGAGGTVTPSGAA